MSKVGCVYHSVDLDGWMSASIVKLFFNGKEDVGFIPYNYGNPIPDLSVYDKIVMCDISLPKEHMEVIGAYLQENFIWCDHHVSAIKDGDGMFYSNCSGLRDVNFSACELTWMHFFPEDKMPEIVRLLGRYDCFGHKGTEEEVKVLEFQYGARQIISNHEEAYEYLCYCVNQEKENDIENMIHQQGKSIYSYLCTEAKQAYKNRFTVYLGDYAFCCINKERFNPINFGIQYHNDKADDIYFYDGVACFHYANNKWNFSLYNDNGHVDVSLIAKGFGGGGHKGAAGFVVEDLNTVFTQPKQ